MMAEVTEAVAVVDAWLAGVNGGAIERVLALYDEQAVLLPTFSNQRHDTPDGIRRYFERLAARDGLQVDLHRATMGTLGHGGRLASTWGIYRWCFLVDGQPLAFEARFTFLLDPGHSRPILHHHSSQVPRSL